MELHIVVEASIVSYRANAKTYGPAAICKPIVFWMSFTQRDRIFWLEVSIGVVSDRCGETPIHKSFKGAIKCFKSVMLCHFFFFFSFVKNSYVNRRLCLQYAAYLATPSLSS